MRKNGKEKRVTRPNDYQFKDLQESIGVTFTNSKLLKQAFTHSSYVNEHRRKPYEDNERLEFLGDAVLELTVSKFFISEIPNDE